MSVVRIYSVRHQGAVVALVRASSPAQAVRHIVSKAYDAAVADVETVVRVLKQGIDVQDAGEDGAGGQDASKEIDA